MGISLIDSGRENCYERDGSKIFYTEALPRDVDKIQGDHYKNKNGKFKVDFSSAKSAILKKYVTRWEGVEGAASPADLVDVKGYQIPAIELLPGEDRDALYLAITGRTPDEEDEDEGNG